MNSEVVDQDRATCYHEAAHAVFAVLVCESPVRYVDADERICMAGLMNYNGTNLHMRCQFNWQNAMQTLSGWLAENLAIDGETNPKSWEEFYEDNVAPEWDDWEPEGDEIILVRHLQMISEPEEFSKAMEKLQKMTRASFRGDLEEAHEYFPTEFMNKFSIPEEFDPYSLTYWECLREMRKLEGAYRIVVRDTERRVHELWPEITAVAEALLLRRRLEGDEVSRIIYSARHRGEA